MVFNRPGPNWHRRAEFAADAAEHRNIYVRLADRGDILAGGRLEGDPAVGISIFRPGIAERDIRPQLENDRLVREGVIAIEFRMLALQNGAIR